MAEAHSKFQGQFPGSLPRILSKEFPSGVVNGIDTVKVGFVVICNVSGQQVGVLVSITEAIAGRDLDQAVAIVVGRLCILDPFVEPAELQRVTLQYFGERVAAAGHVFVRIQAGRGSAGFESARIEYEGRFTGAVLSKRRNLRNAILE